MTGFALLDVAIGVIFAILTFSLVASALQESFASIFNWRGRFLRRGLFRLLENEENGRALLANTVFWPKMPGGLSKATLDRAELTFEVLNDPSMRALHGSKTFIGEAVDWVLAIPRVVARLAFRKSEDTAKEKRQALDKERTDRVVATLARPDMVADSAALSQAVSDINTDIAARKAALDQKQDQAHPIQRAGRVPSAIPRETFASALIDTLHRRIEAAVQDASDTVKAHADAAAQATETAVKSAHAAALKEAEAAKKRAEDAGQPPPGDPKTIADDLVYATFGAAAPGKAYAEAYTTALSKTVDAAAQSVADTIDELPMSRDLKARLTKALRAVSISRAVEDHLAKIDQLWDGAEASLEAHVKTFEAKATEVAQSIAEWFDHGMDRVTGWYIRRAKYVLFLIGVSMAAAINFNIIGYAGELMKNEALRDQVVARAQFAVDSGSVGSLKIDQSARVTLLALAVRQQPGPTADIGKLTKTKVATYAFTLEDLQSLGLDAEAANDNGTLKGLAVDQVMKALQKAAPDVKADANGDGTVSLEEVDAAIAKQLEQIGNTVDTALETLDTQLAGEGYVLGWSCEPLAWQCVKDQTKAVAVLSWFIMGVVCTFGGQFWFDLLKSVIGVRTAATGLNSDVKDFIKDLTSKEAEASNRQGAPPPV